MSDLALVATTTSAASDTQRKAQVERSAEEFESVFLSQMLREMTSSLTGPGSLAGAEVNPFTGMLQDEYARLLARSGGIGIAGSVMHELLTTQDVAVAAGR